MTIPPVLNIGSINEDRVYHVPHIARAGETVAGTEFAIFPGGKGANQSVALAHAGVPVFHAGKIGTDGRWLRQRLEKEGVNTAFVDEDDAPTGHANIQVDAGGENSIVLFGGTNRRLDLARMDAAISQFPENSTVLLQNEVNLVPDLIAAGHRQGMTVCFNPAPMTDAVHHYPLEKVDVFFLNTLEAAALAGNRDTPDNLLRALRTRFPRATLVITLGSDGALYDRKDEAGRISAVPVEPVDTTAAGDTFIGFCLAAMLEAKPLAEAVRFGCRAAACAVTVNGAMSSIPQRAEVERAMDERRRDETP